MNTQLLRYLAGPVAVGLGYAVTAVSHALGLPMTQTATNEAAIFLATTAVTFAQAHNLLSGNWSKTVAQVAKDAAPLVADVEHAAGATPAEEKATTEVEKVAVELPTVEEMMAAPPARPADVPATLPVVPPSVAAPGQVEGV